MGKQVEQKKVKPKISDWEVKVKVWQRQAIGDNKSAIRRYLERHAGDDGYPEFTPDRATIAKICDELRTLSPELVLKLPSEVQAYAQKLNPHLEASLGLQPSDSRKTLTVEKIVIGEERKQAVLRHQDDLRNMASQWKSQIWIPSPWLWDVTDLNYVFYVDSKSHRTGYKLLEELESGEESNGHIKPFLESSNSVIWEVLEGGPIMLKTLVEDELFWGYLKSHTEKSSVWGLFTEWKEKGGTYIQLCSSLLAQIEREAKEKVGATSELSWWSIYHDAFCNEYTPLCCVKCGTRNSSVFTCPICRGKFPHEEEIELHIENNHPKADPKAWPWPHCQICYSPLGLLRPLVKQYEFHKGKNPQSVRIDIEGGRNIEESVENERVNNYILGHAKLIDDYRGCDLVETILEAEKKVREVQVRLISEITSLSEQRVFHGKCSACPD